MGSSVLARTQYAQLKPTKARDRLLHSRPCFEEPPVNLDRKKLTDIRKQHGGSWINGNWSDIAPAPEFGPVPAGIYEAHLIGKDAFRAGTGTPGIKLTFSILNDGPYKGRRQWYDIWLSEANSPNARRDFAKLGIHEKSQIDLPLPTDKRIRCRIVVVVDKIDNGDLFNKVKRFEAIGLDPVEADPFAPKDSGVTT
jgi:hypothetical protein